MSNPAAYAGELLHNIIEEKNNSPDYNVSIYISTLWGVKKQSGGGGDNGDKLSKTGDTMFGNLEMGGNKITGLSSEYPPSDLNNAASWGQVGLGLDNYVHKAGSMMTGWLGVGRGITLGNDAVKIMSRPIEDVDATNKEYVDSKITKPIITIWASAKNKITSGNYDWFFGASGKSTTILNGGYRMLANGRVLRSATVVYNNRGIKITERAPVAKLVINGELKEFYEAFPGVITYNVPLELRDGDNITFQSFITANNVGSATISLLIELDL